MTTKALVLSALAFMVVTPLGPVAAGECDGWAPKPSFMLTVRARLSSGAMIIDGGQSGAAIQIRAGSTLSEFTKAAKRVGIPFQHVSKDEIKLCNNMTARRLFFVDGKLTEFEN